MPFLRWLLPYSAVVLVSLHAQAAPPPEETASPGVTPRVWPMAGLEGGFDPLERRLLDDAADGRFDEHSLLTAALVASGVLDSEVIHGYERQFDGWVAEFESASDPHAATRAKAESLFELMHTRILRGGYAIACTELSCVFEEGRFNCVSATVLFHCLATRVGLPAVALELPGHAMTRLECDGESLDIETTCPRWFRLADRSKESSVIAEPIAGLPPGGDRNRRRPISPVQLVAMIYYNRGVDLLAAKNFPESLAANAKALRLDPASTTARGNLLATLNNWAIDLASARHFAPAAALLSQGLDFDPHYETFRVNYAHVHRQWVESLCSEGRFDEARTVGQQGFARLPEDPFLRSVEAQIALRAEGTPYSLQGGPGGSRGDEGDLEVPPLQRAGSSEE